MDAPGHKRLGDSLQTEGRLDEAIAEYERALLIDRHLQSAWYASGCAWLAKDAYATALAYFDAAAALSPDDVASHQNAGTAYFKLGLTDDAIARFRLALLSDGNFLSRTSIATAIPGSPAADHAAVLAARREWSETHLPPPRPRALRPPIRTDAPLRIGYLCSFFGSRNWMKPVWALVNQHDRREFEIHLFSDCAESKCDGYERHERDRFHDISGVSNRDAAARIEDAGIAVLVDLNGFSCVPRLAVPALTPAPVQVAWFNMYATSGMRCFDYLIADAHVVAPEEEPYYTETIVRVPGSYLTFDVRYPVPDVSDPPALAAGFVTFGCLAPQYKITPAAVDAWARILSRLPSSKLFLKNKAFGNEANRTHLVDRFGQRGIAADRLELEGPAEHFDFVAAYSRIDIALDTFPYNGGTTTTEAIWQGVPVVTFRGDRWASRQSTSILRTAGLDAFVCADVDEYVELAVALAEDRATPRRLAELRCGMRARLAASKVCDTAAFARAMESHYREFALRRPTAD
jgi:predicted O-linked N-acetylglucosamine transferase (SPINDLY family)